VGRFEGKTEKATPERRRKARREGQIPRSAELPVAASLLGAALVLKVGAPSAIRVLERETALLFTGARGDAVPGALINASVGRMVLALLGPFLTVAVGTAVIAGVAQTGEPSLRRC
jgi:flagellar biosynthetic protein FlhB